MGQEGVTREDFLTLWDVIKRLYRSHVRANADRAALLQILREELNESSDEVLSRLEEFHESDVYQRELHDCEKLFYQSKNRFATAMIFRCSQH